MLGNDYWYIPVCDSVFRSFSVALILSVAYDEDQTLEMRQLLSF